MRKLLPFVLCCHSQKVVVAQEEAATVSQDCFLLSNPKYALNKQIKREHPQRAPYAAPINQNVEKISENSSAGTYDSSTCSEMLCIIREVQLVWHSPTGQTQLPGLFRLLCT